MGADFDGNTGTMIPIHGHESIRECKSWPNMGLSDGDMRDALSLIPMTVSCHNGHNKPIRQAFLSTTTTFHETDHVSMR